jgi:hypothetical protein
MFLTTTSANLWHFQQPTAGQLKLAFGSKVLQKFYAYKVIENRHM